MIDGLRAALGREQAARALAERDWEAFPFFQRPLFLALKDLRVLLMREGTYRKTSSTLEIIPSVHFLLLSFLA